MEWLKREGKVRSGSSLACELVGSHGTAEMWCEPMQSVRSLSNGRKPIKIGIFVVFFTISWPSGRSRYPPVFGAQGGGEVPSGLHWDPWDSVNGVRTKIHHFYPMLYYNTYICIYIYTDIYTKIITYIYVYISPLIVVQWESFDQLWKVTYRICFLDL